jgi:hypothetical protein
MLATVRLVILAHWAFSVMNAMHIRHFVPFEFRGFVSSFMHPVSRHSLLVALPFKIDRHSLATHARPQGRPRGNIPLKPTGASRGPIGFGGGMPEASSPSASSSGAGGAAAAEDPATRIERLERKLKIAIAECHSYRQRMEGALKLSDNLEMELHALKKVRVLDIGLAFILCHVPENNSVSAPATSVFETNVGIHVSCVFRDSQNLVHPSFRRPHRSATTS